VGLLRGAVGTTAAAVPSLVCSVMYWQSAAVLDADGREQASATVSDRLRRRREQQL